jgi:hypothetical protein
MLFQTRLFPFSIGMLNNEDGCLLGCCSMQTGRYWLQIKNSIIQMLTYRPVDGGSKLLWNVGECLPDYTAQHPRRQPPSYSSPWEPEISPMLSNVHDRVCVLFINYYSRCRGNAMKGFFTLCDPQILFFYVCSHTWKFVSLGVKIKTLQTFDRFPVNVVFKENGMRVPLASDITGFFFLFFFFSSLPFLSKACKVQVKDVMADNKIHSPIKQYVK